MKKVFVVLAFAAMTLTASAQDSKWQFEGDPVEGMILVMDQDDKWGFLDEKHNVVIPCTWDYAENFAEGMARVCKDELFGFIDKTGKLVIPCKYAKEYDFSEGLAGVMDPMTGKYGFIDKTGRVIIPFKWQDVTPFENGWAEGVNASGRSVRIDMPKELQDAEAVRAFVETFYNNWTDQLDYVYLKRYATPRLLKYLADSYDYDCEGECLATWMFFYEGGGDVGEKMSRRFTARDNSHVLVETKYDNYEYAVLLTVIKDGKAFKIDELKQERSVYSGENDDIDYSSGDEYNKDLRSLVEGDD